MPENISISGQIRDVYCTFIEKLSHAKICAGLLIEIWLMDRMHCLERNIKSRLVKILFLAKYENS